MTKIKVTKIRKLFTETFIDKKQLEENDITYPIKLDYYKLKNEENEYGIEVVKTEYHDGFETCEKGLITKITQKEEFIENIIQKLKENFVTPCGLKDVINEAIVTVNRR